MEAPDSFSQLLDYPKEKKLNYETHLNEQRFYLSHNDPILYKTSSIPATGSINTVIILSKK